jgi:hypothetical protein
MGIVNFNKWEHIRTPTPLDAQTVIRMNRDTLYSATLIDISKGATLTIPEVGDRYLSIMVVNEDHYINKVYHYAGTYELTMEEFHTPYVSLSVRTLVDSSDQADIKEVNALQDQLMVKAASAKPYTHPNYDQVSYEATYKPLIELSRGIAGTERMYGKKEEVGETRHLLGTAFGWGGLPDMRPTTLMWSRTFRWAPISSQSKTYRWMPSGPSAFITGMVIFKKMNTMLIA